MLKQCLSLVTVVLMAATIAFTQGTFKPRNLDEEHAWRLYNQYKTSKKNEAQLTGSIKQRQADVRTTAVGSIPIVRVDPNDTAELNRWRQQLKTEQARQKNLENAWDKKFSGRYGDLKDSASPIYDPKTKKMMDKIQFRLISFPFYVNDGTYVGTITGAPGQITLIVNGTSVTGTMRGVYKYMIGSTASSSSFTGSISGTLSSTGSLSGRLSGNVGGVPFSGTLSGSITKFVASGTWTSKAVTAASGSFRATRR